MAVGRTARDIGNRVGDVRDAEGAAAGGEKFDDRLAPRGVALVDAAQVNLHQFVELRVRGVGGVGCPMRGASHRPVSLRSNSLSCNETQSHSTLVSVRTYRSRTDDAMLLVRSA